MQAGRTGQARSLSAYRGCLLGMAVGDAMGYTVDSRSWQEIREDYGPHGLLGYDLVNGYADVTSYTQIAAFTANGLLLALTRGQMVGKIAPFVKYVALAEKEWAASQRPWGRPERTFCWLIRQPEMCRRVCMDTRMLDSLNRPTLGTPEEPTTRFSGPGSLTAAIGVGLFSHPNRMKQQELDLLGAEAVALSHGAPQAFLSGAALAHMISRKLWNPDMPLKKLVQETCQALKDQFGHQYSQCYELCNLLNMALSLSEGCTPAAQVMEQLHCETAGQCLAAAVYACGIAGEEFDAAVISAVNHSGRSAAVGAVAGALQGLTLGEEALPGFYIDCLEPGELLQELADDLYHGCPMEMGSKLFDSDWDSKYLHGGR